MAHYGAQQLGTLWHTQWYKKFYGTRSTERSTEASYGVHKKTAWFTLLLYSTHAVAKSSMVHTELQGAAQKLNSGTSTLVFTIESGSVVILVYIDGSSM